MASEILMFMGSTTITMLKGPRSRSETFSICATKRSHSASSSMYCWRHVFITFTQYCSQGFSEYPMQEPHDDILVSEAMHSCNGRIESIDFETSAAALSAWTNVRVATKDRFTCTESLSGTSPNGLRSFMYSLTQFKYLKEIKESMMLEKLNLHVHHKSSFILLWWLHFPLNVLFFLPPPPYRMNRLINNKSRRKKSNTEIPFAWIIRLKRLVTWVWEIYGDFIQSTFSHRKWTQQKECASCDMEKQNERTKASVAFKSFRDN